MRDPGYEPEHRELPVDEQILDELVTIRGLLTELDHTARRIMQKLDPAPLVPQPGDPGYEDVPF